jgi:hypothetical protein
MAEGLRLWVFFALGGEVGGECGAEESDEFIERAASEDERSRILFKTSGLPSLSGVST